MILTARFGALPDGRAVQLYTIRNAGGMELRVIDYGAIIVAITAADRNGTPADVVLGYDSLDEYINDVSFIGALAGRYANRIAGARFELDGQVCALPANDGRNCLHGGPHGFHRMLWSAEPFSRTDAQGVILRHISPDGAAGFPGTLHTQVTYTLTDANQLAIDYLATASRPTPVNLTQHSYFNLTGDGARDILGHVVHIDADRFTPVNAELIPTGELRAVAGTPLDFRTPRAIGERIGDTHQQLRLNQGYDHNFVLKASGPHELKRAAVVYEPGSGRVLEVHTTEPGMQFYTGNHLPPALPGKHGVVYRPRSGLALETQHFPDSPNQPGFPSTIVRPDTAYRSRTVFAFVVRA